MSAGNNTYKINSLNRDNYAVWHQQLEWILNDLDLWDETNNWQGNETTANNITIE